MKTRTYSLTVIAVLVVAALACTMPGPTDPTPATPYTNVPAIVPTPTTGAATAEPTAEPVTVTVTSGAEDDIRVPSPDGLKTILIRKPDYLVLQTEHDSGSLVRRGPEIIEAVWFPDSRHLLYTVLDKKDAPDGPTFTWTYEMFMYDIETNEDSPFVGPNESGHTPVIAPDGRTVALLVGTLYGDAGFVDLSLGFITLDANYDGTNFFFAQDFAPLPPDSRGQIYPDFDFAEQDPVPGTWDDSNTFRAHLNELAEAYPGFEPGVYLLHVDTLSAERVGDLP